MNSPPFAVAPDAQDRCYLLAKPSNARLGEFLVLRLKDSSYDAAQALATQLNKHVLGVELERTKGN